MKKLIAGAVCAATLFAFAAPAFAMDDAMAMKPAEMATMLCRPAMAGEKMTAMSATKAKMVCKTIKTDEMMAMKKKIEAMPGGEALWLRMFQDYHIGMNGVPG
jgi:hypothetical protein